MKKDKIYSCYVLYHNYCMDGLAAAYAYDIAIENSSTVSLKQWANIKYIPVEYNKPFPLPLDNIEEGTYKDSEIVILDFSYPFTVFEKLKSLFKHVTMIDHHKTSFENYGFDIQEVVDVKVGNSRIVLDNSQSGAVLTWKHFHPSSTPLPEFYSYIQDNDLGQWKLPQTDAFQARIKALVNFNHFSEIDELFELFSADKDKFLEEGEACLSLLKAQCARLIKQLEPRHYFASWKSESMLVACINAPHEFATMLAKEFFSKPVSDAFAFIVIYAFKNNELTLSFRSTSDREDVSAIAKSFGGGGHRNASGAALSLEKFNRSFEQIK